jgi:molybdate transport system substrate-binding protein
VNGAKIATLALALMLAPSAAHTAEIKVLASGALKLVLPELTREFRRSSSTDVTIEYNPAGAIADRVRKGEAADVAIVTKPQLERLEDEGKIVKGSRVGIAGISIGVAVRKGSPKPDISTVDAFKRALLSARAIGYRDPATGSTSGTYTARLLERLGIAAAVKPKTRLDRSNGEHPEQVFEPLANGEIDLQIGQITEIVIAPGVDLAGPLPPEIQDTTVLAAGILVTSKAPDDARAFIRYLTSPPVAKVLSANGFLPTAEN